MLLGLVIKKVTWLSQPGLLDEMVVGVPEVLQAAFLNPFKTFPLVLQEQANNEFGGYRGGAGRGRGRSRGVVDDHDGNC
jgi:hypothetical protein